MFPDAITLRKSKVLVESIPIVAFVCLMVLASKVSVLLPFTPVPLTLQVFLVILSGLVLGARKAAITQASFLGLILVGAPVTATALSGPAAFVGPTAGYLLAFLPAAYVIGLISDRSHKHLIAFVAGLLGITIIYLFGTLWLSVYLHDFHKAFVAGVVPFIVFDILKAVFAVSLTQSLRGFGKQG